MTVWSSSINSFLNRFISSSGQWSVGSVRLCQVTTVGSSVTELREIALVFRSPNKSFSFSMNFRFRAAPLTNDECGTVSMANCTVYWILAAGWTTTTRPSFAVRLPLSSQTCAKTLVNTSVQFETQDKEYLQKETKCVRVCKRLIILFSAQQPPHWAMASPFTRLLDHARCTSR